MHQQFHWCNKHPGRGIEDQEGGRILALPQLLIPSPFSPTSLLFCPISSLFLPSLLHFVDYMSSSCPQSCLTSTAAATNDLLMAQLLPTAYHVVTSHFPCSIPLIHVSPCQQRHSCLVTWKRPLMAPAAMGCCAGNSVAALPGGLGYLT